MKERLEEALEARERDVSIGAAPATVEEDLTLPAASDGSEPAIRSLR